MVATCYPKIATNVGRIGEEAVFEKRQLNKLPKAD